MKKLGCAIIVSLLMAAGCSKKSDTREPSEIPTAPEPAQPEQPSEPVAQAPLAGEELGKRFDALLEAFNAKDAAALAGFFATDASTQVVGTRTELKGSGDLTDQLFKPLMWTAFPDLRVTRQLAIVDGTQVVAIVHATGTNTGPMGTAGPTNKKIGLYGVVHAHFNAEGKIEKQALLIDPGVALAQLGILRMPTRPVDVKGWDESQREIVVSSASAEEQARMNEIKAADTAFASGKLDQVVGVFADDAAMIDLSMPADIKGKPAMQKMLDEYAKMFGDYAALDAQYLAAGQWVLSRMDYRMTAIADDPATKTKMTGKTVQSTDYNFFRFTGDRVSHMYSFHNGLDMATQLGMVGDEKGAKPRHDKKTKTR